MADELPTIEAWITFAGPIDNMAASKIFGGFQLLVQANVTRAHLLIQSAGGVVGDGIAIYNYLRHLPLEIVSYNAGAVESIAVLIYLAGKVRKASKHSIFLIHKTTFPLMAPVGAMELSVRADAARLNDGNVEAILRSEISLPDEKWATHSVSDLVISADDALGCKLVHEIGDFKPPRGGALFNIGSINP